MAIFFSLVSVAMAAEYDIELSLKCSNPQIGQPCEFTFSTKKGEEPFLVSSRNIEKTFLGCRSKEVAFFGLENIRENENNSDYIEGRGTLIFLKSFPNGIKATVIKKDDISLALSLDTKIVVEAIDEVSSPNFYNIGNNLKIFIMTIILIAMILGMYIVRKVKKPKKNNKTSNKKPFFDEVTNKSDVEKLVFSLSEKKKVIKLKSEFMDLFNIGYQIQYKKEISADELNNLNKRIRDLKKEWK